VTHWTDAISDVLTHQERLDADLEYFAEQLLKIRPKAGRLEPFTFNPAQIALHRRLEEQKAKTGKVRAIVLKARQMGISTYIAARFYRQTVSNEGLRCIILGHEKRASTNLFQLVKRYHENLPEEMRQPVGTSNAEELLFSKIDSGYLVSVATTEGAGRSATAQLLHGSEVAFWPDLHEQLAALLQTIPDIDGTEVVLESTGNTFGDQFHQLWRAAEAGESEFLPIFLPWSIDPTYRTKVPGDFSMDAEETSIASLHGLDAEQIFWRRRKIAELRSVDLFKREYPLTPDEAFMASQFDSFITADLVLAARKEMIEPYGPLIVGVDPAGKGADSSAIAWRQGHCITKIERRRGLTTMELAGRVAAIIRDDKPVKVNIDVGGLGIGVYERLVEEGYGDVVNAVNFGGKPIEPPPLDEAGKPAGGPANRRAEMWGNLKKALHGRFSLPDSDSLQSDLTGVGYKYMGDGRLLLEAKEDMKKRGMPSPDEGDAVALCFSEPEGAPFPRSSNFNRKLVYTDHAYA